MLPTRPPVSATRHLLLCWHLGSVLATALSPLVIALLHAQLAVGERVVEGLLPAATSRSFEAAVLDDVRRLRSNDAQKCLVWNRLTPSDLCELTPWKRLKRMRSVLLFQQDCREETNVQLWELFLLGTREWSAESDLYVTANLAHLRNDSGRDCVQAEAGSQRCLRCFGLVDELMDAVHRYYVNFNRTLSRFDCSMLGWTDRRFSPNATCDHCKACCILEARAVCVGVFWRLDDGCCVGILANAGAVISLHARNGSDRCALSHIVHGSGANRSLPPAGS
uniref:Uncharacterized protein n=1 Tax=Plectus sambesii TaxID=2011161 RepID=A0A914WVU9_9BILA